MTLRVSCMSERHLPPRLELFSDALFAILITIMVLELQPPATHHFADLIPLGPIFLSYLLSFLFLFIYWNNHHHLLQAMHEPTPKIMWANAHLLFWLSLVPFVTAWMGEGVHALAPAVLYGMVMVGATVAYFLLHYQVVGQSRESIDPVQVVLLDIRQKLSLVLYLSAIPLAFVSPYISYVIYTVVALFWVVPRRLF